MTGCGLLACVPGSRRRLVVYTREAGGGGDCMFHSVAACFGNSRGDMMAMRSAAASAVNPANVDDVLVDMGAVRIDEPDLTTPVRFASATDQSGLAFDPQAIKEGPDPVARLQASIRTKGNHFWGDATTAALLEDALGVNIVLLAATGQALQAQKHKHHPHPAEQTANAQARATARNIYARWVRELLETRPELIDQPADRIIAALSRQGKTAAGALSIASVPTTNPALRAWRMPVGTTRRTCEAPADPSYAPYNSNLHGLDPTRPTIVLLNSGNVHWKPAVLAVIDTENPTAPDTGEMDPVIPPGTDTADLLRAALELS